MSSVCLPGSSVDCWPLAGEKSDRVEVQRMTCKEETVCASALLPEAAQKDRQEDTFDDGHFLCERSTNLLEPGT